MYTNMAESEVECFSGVKQLKLKEDVPGVILP